MVGERGGSAAVETLTGARVPPEPRAAPSSGTSVVPFGVLERPRAQWRRLGFSSQLRWCTGDPAPLGRSLAATAGGSAGGEAQVGHRRLFLLGLGLAFKTRSVSFDLSFDSLDSSSNHCLPTQSTH